MAMFSRTLYYTLDHLGYNDDIIKFRSETWKYRAELENKYTIKGSGHCIIPGSKGEGITSVLESDIDIIYQINKILCINTVEQLPSQLPHHITVFIADMVNVPPGYTRLKLYRTSSSRNVRDPEIRECLFKSESGEVYLSSTLWTTMLKKNVPVKNDGRILHDVTGPAVPSSGDGLDTDCVLGFTFHCPQLLQTWASRPRHHEWPSRHTIQTACSFLPQVVPVGAKGSDRQFQEWRFCFIESELTLTHSLNGAQKKLYILLKMIAKSILKHVTGEISSYIMKNVTYWLSELLPLHVFREEKLVSLVLLALEFLRTAITRWQNLPYYMIPSRNLLSERLDANTRRELSDVLGGLIQEGPRLFLRIEKLRICLEATCRAPNDIVKYGKMRDQIEKNFLVVIVFDILKLYGIHLDESIKANVEFSINNLVVSQMRSMYPFRYGRFGADEITQATRMILS